MLLLLRLLHSHNQRLRWRLRLLRRRRLVQAGRTQHAGDGVWHCGAHQLLVLRLLALIMVELLVLMVTLIVMVLLLELLVLLEVLAR